MRVQCSTERLVKVFASDLVWQCHTLALSGESGGQANTKFVLVPNFWKVVN